MSIRVMTTVWDQSTAEGSALLLLLAIADHAHDDGTGAWPSVDALAKKTRQTPRNTQFLLRRLERLGELVTEIGAGPHGCNAYRIVLGDEKFSGVKSSTPGVKSSASGVKSSVENGRQISPESSLKPSMNLPLADARGDTAAPLDVTVSPALNDPIEMEGQSGRCPQCGRHVTPNDVACPDCGQPFHWRGSKQQAKRDKKAKREAADLKAKHGRAKRESEYTPAIGKLADMAHKTDPFNKASLKPDEIEKLLTFEATYPGSVDRAMASVMERGGAVGRGLIVQVINTLPHNATERKQQNKTGETPNRAAVDMTGKEWVFEPSDRH